MNRENALQREGPPVEASKILSALERVSQAFRTLLWLEGKKRSLNPIQIQILAFLWKQPASRRKVSAISEAFDLSRASVSETVKALAKRDLVFRESDPRDSRSSILSLTSSGIDAAFETSAYSSKVLESLKKMGTEERRLLYLTLNQLILDLNASGVITVQRMCMNCHYYESRGEAHYCHLLKQELRVGELKMDCAEHVPRKG